MGGGSLEASSKNRTFLYSLTRFNMADYKQRVPKLIGESADQHLPPLKEKKNNNKSWFFNIQQTKVSKQFGNRTLDSVHRQCSEECLVCDIVFQSFWGFDYPPRSCLLHWVPVGVLGFCWFL